MLYLNILKWYFGKFRDHFQKMKIFYFSKVCNAFVFYDIKRYDIRGKSIWKVLRNSIYAIPAFVMLFSEAETWIMEEYMRI